MKIHVPQKQCRIYPGCNVNRNFRNCLLGQGITAAYVALPAGPGSNGGKSELGVEGAVGAGVAAAAPIILITAAGGGFGGVIGATGVGVIDLMHKTFFYIYIQN